MVNRVAMTILNSSPSIRHNDLFGYVRVQNEKGAGGFTAKRYSTVYTTTFRLDDRFAIALGTGDRYYGKLAMSGTSGTKTTVTVFDSLGKNHYN